MGDSDLIGEEPVYESAEAAQREREGERERERKGLDNA